MEHECLVNWNTSSRIMIQSHGAGVVSLGAWCTFSRSQEKGHMKCWSPELACGIRVRWTLCTARMNNSWAFTWYKRPNKRLPGRQGVTRRGLNTKRLQVHTIIFGLLCHRVKHRGIWTMPSGAKPLQAHESLPSSWIFFRASRSHRIYFTKITKDIHTINIGK